jgi:hypothetical protein
MAAAAICGKAHAWEDELAALAQELPRLPPAARLAVRSVLDALLADGTFDSRQSREAERLRDALGASTRLAEAA